MRHYTIYIPILSSTMPPFFAVVYDESRCYIVPAAPGGWQQRSSLGDLMRYRDSTWSQNQCKKVLLLCSYFQSRTEPIEYV